MIAYANLKAEMARREIRNTQIAEIINVSEKTFRNKQRGLTPFTWEEVKTIHNTFFQDVELEELFKTFN